MSFDTLYCLLTHPTLDPSMLARSIEPHLPLIKSRALNALYFSLRAQEGNYTNHLPLLLEESRMDYRLDRLLQRLPSLASSSLVSSSLASPSDSTPLFHS